MFDFRAFSIFAHTKQKRRSKLKDKTIEAILRLRINGPDDPDMFDPYKYADLWVKEGHLRADDPSQIRKEKKKKLLAFNREAEDDEESEEEEKKKKKLLLSDSSLF